MNDKEAVSYLRTIGVKFDETEKRLKKVEDLIKYDPKNGITIKGPIHYSGNLFPTTLSDIGSPNNFVSNLYLSGKIIYPDALDFGVNNDFCIDKMGKIGFHTNQKLDGVTIKGLPCFTIENALYIGDSTLLFQISSGTMEEFLGIQDIIIIENNYYQVLQIFRDRAIIDPLNKERIPLEENQKYNLTVYNNLFGFVTAKDEDILKVNALGDIFYKTTQREAEININGTTYFNKNVFIRNLDINHLTIKNPEIIANLNAEFLCGKKGPENGEIVSTKDKQQLWCKSFGDDLSMSNNRITDLGDPLYDMDVANKRYVDRYLSGIRISQSVKCATTGNLEADYSKSEMKLHLRTNDKLEKLATLFDGYEIQINQRCILLHQHYSWQNGIYIVVESENRIVLQRTHDFCPKRELNDLKAFYVFIENGRKYGNTGVCFDYFDDFIWEESPVSFNIFSRAESYGVGQGIKKTRNNFSLNISDVFGFNEDKLEIKRGKVSNHLLENSHMNFISDGGIDFDKSVINLGDYVKIGLKVDRKQFHFGKNGELQINSFLTGNQKTLENWDELNVNKNISAVGALQNVYQLFPPGKFEVHIQYSEDFFEKEKDKSVQYYICTLNQEGKETNYKSSDEFHISDEVKSIFANLEWGEVKGCDGYVIYRRINRSYSFIKLSPLEKNMLDVLVPRNFTKIDWKECDEPSNKNQTVMIVNRIATLGENYLNSGALGIGTVKPKAALHVISNEVNSTGTPLILEMGENGDDMIRMIKKGVSIGGTVKISGECSEGTSVIEMGKNIRLLAEEEGVVFLGRKSSPDDDINYRLGSDTFTVQVPDGGLYTSGEILTGEGKSLGTFNNKLGNNAAILRTGCVSNSIGNQVAFAWEGEDLKAIPLNDGSMLTKKKVSVKNFTIEHPLDREKYLIHACLEGPTADVFYRGRGVIRANRYTTEIDLPEYFSDLIEYGTSTLMLTLRGNPFARIAGTVYETQNIIKVEVAERSEHAIDFYWEVKATRKHTAFNPEPKKKDVQIYGMGPYTYFL